MTKIAEKGRQLRGRGVTRLDQLGALGRREVFRHSAGLRRGYAQQAVVDEKALAKKTDSIAYKPQRYLRADSLASKMEGDAGITNGFVEPLEPDQRFCCRGPC